MRFIDITGIKFHMLTPIERKYENEISYWLCNCDCGDTTIVVKLSDLKSGNTKSCGCLRIDAAKIRSTTHGKSKENIYRTWKNMKTRCLNSKNKAFKLYGGRGIKICEEWVNSFETFYEWAHKNGYKDNLSIERVNVNGNYEPNNCTWIPMSEQSKNRRKKRKTMPS